MFSCLPAAGGLLDQPVELIEGIRLWRWMRHIKDLMDSDDGDEKLLKTPNGLYWQDVINVGIDDANAMVERYRKDKE